MQKNPRIQVILIALICLLVGYYFGINKVNFDWTRYHPSISVESKEPPTGVTNVDFTQFWNVWEKLQTDYYDKTKVDPQKMLNGAIEGMVGSLDDPFTLYLPPTQNTDFKQGLAGQFEGIGAELGLSGKQIIIIAPINGSPAQKAGLRAGDSILAVEGQSTAGWTLSQAVDKIRGTKGSVVTLTIMHKGDKASKDYKITRDVITVKSVTAWVKKISDVDSINIDKKYANEKVAYIDLSQFGDNTNSEWLSVINQLNLDINKTGGVKGIVFDLRNNPGGYLTDAVFVASEFLPEGATVVSEEDKTGSNILKADRKGLFTDNGTPIIVLINKGSASASEIVAGALKDNGRAKLAGETSFGKGTVQQAEDLGGGAGLHVTIAKWLTPNGTWVNGKGLTPDVSASLDPAHPEMDNQLGRAVLELVQ